VQTFIGPKAAEQINVASDHYRVMEQHVQKKVFHILPCPLSCALCHVLTVT